MGIYRIGNVARPPPLPHSPPPGGLLWARVSFHLHFGGAGFNKTCFGVIVESCGWVSGPTKA